MPLIEVRSLSHSYPGSLGPALDGVSFTVEEGEYLAIVGANGSGKSTLARCLNGLVAPTPGSVLIGGFDPSNPDGRRRARMTLSLVFQSPPDQIVASVVEEDVAFGPENLGMARNDMRVRVDQALAATGLTAERKRPPRFLSAGQQQRLAVAGAVAMRPRCVVFDEATSMIDPRGREDILALMDDLVRSGIAVIAISHDMAEASRAGRVIALSRGRVAFDGSPAQLFASGNLDRLSLALPPSAADFRSAIERPREAYVAGESAFRLEGVSFSYLSGGPNERLALDSLSLSVPLGASMAIVGPTGSGKSTILQLMASLSFPQAGRVYHFGADTLAKDADTRSMRMRSPLSVQRPESAMFEFYAGDEAAFGPRNQGLKGEALVARVSKAMDEVGLPYREFRDRRARSLSGGEKRRLAIASILAMEPDALLLDEPSSALDPMGRLAIMDLLFAYASGGSGDGRAKRPPRRTLVFATHSMEEAARADIVAVACKGRIVASGRPADVFGPLWDETWGLLRPGEGRKASRA